MPHLQENSSSHRRSRLTFLHLSPESQILFRGVHHTLDLSLNRFHVLSVTTPHQPEADAPAQFPSVSQCAPEGGEDLEGLRLLDSARTDRINPQILYQGDPSAHMLFICWEQSFVPQRHHRINPRGSSCRNKARRKRHRQQHNRHADERPRIRRAQAVKLACH